LQVVHQHPQIIGKRREADPIRIAQWPRLTMSARIEGEQTKSGRGLEQVEDLIHITPQAVLEKEGRSTAFVEVMEVQSVVLKEWHGCKKMVEESLS
jgi:hypothetical protein